MSGGADLRLLARAVQVLDGRTALIDGQKVTDRTSLPQSAHSSVAVDPGSGEEGPSPGPSWLTAQLYARLYVRPAGRARNTADAVEVRDFRASLSEANHGIGTWENGWLLEGETSPRRGLVHVRVSRYGVAFVTSRDRVRPGPEGLRAGSACHVRVPKERRELHPGYYYFLGDAPWSGFEERGADLVRVYWNVRANGAAAWVGATSGELNRRDIPFRAKLIADPDGYGRSDSAVVYLPRDVLPRVVEALAAIHGLVADHLDAQVPMFTRAVAPGVALASDPGNGLSFGQHRCELVASGLFDHLDRGLPDTAQDRYELIARAFQSAGLDPDRPYLAPDEVDVYESLAPSALAGRRDLRAAANAFTGQGRGRYLDTAVHVGHRLCDAAYWNHESQRCTWIGRVLDLSALAHGRTPRPSAASLGWRLYDGHAGVALFLAELYGQTAEERFWKTACGAFRTAVHGIDAVSEQQSVPVGLHTGVGGLLHVARRLATLGDVATVADLGYELAHVGRLLEVIETVGGDSDDVVQGRAGLLLALLSADGVSDSVLSVARTLDVAVDTGRALGDVGLAGVRLAGFAHGAAGIGAALLRASARTGLSELLDAGRSVLDWEDGLFDIEEGRWPDLRELPWSSLASSDPRASATWCNGAAGIGLARLSALEDDSARSSDYAASADRALTLVRSALSVGAGLDDDTSLCHGTAGFVEALLVAGRTLAEPRWVDEARSAAEPLLSGAWSPDRLTLQVRTDPGLMLGVSGVGHQLLRLHAPEAVPGILVPV